MTDALEKIREDAAYWASVVPSNPRPAYEMIEGLAQAILLLREEQRRGWAPLMENVET